MLMQVPPAVWSGGIPRQDMWHIFRHDILRIILRSEELCGNLGDKVDQAALCGFISMTSIPSWNLTPASSFGN